MSLPESHILHNAPIEVCAACLQRYASTWHDIDGLPTSMREVKVPRRGMLALKYNNEWDYVPRKWPVFQQWSHTQPAKEKLNEVELQP